MLFYLCCFYIICFYIRPFEWVPGLVGSPLYIVISVVSILVLLILWASGKIKLFHYKTDQLMLGFTIAIALSHLRHGYFGGAINSLQHFLPVLVGYFLVAHGLKSKKQINLFILLIIGLTSILAYQGVLQGLTGTSAGGMTPIYQNVVNADGFSSALPRIRWYGPFNDPNDLGLALVLVMPFLLNFLFEKRWVFTVPLMALGLYAIYLTNSRGAMLSLAASIFAYLVLRFRSMRGVVLGIILAALGMIFGPSRMSNMSAAEESANGRLEAWYEGFQMFKDNPFFGVGQGMFTDYHYLTAHNSYVLVLSELGFFGSIFFMGFFVISFQWGYSNLLSYTPSLEFDNTVRNKFCALYSSLVGLMTAMFFLSRSYIFLPFMLLALLTAFVNLPEYGEKNAVHLDLVSTFRWGQMAAIVVAEMVFINILVKLFL